MSIRANSLQSLVLDSVYFGALLGLAAATLTAIAQGAEPRVVKLADVTTDRRLTDDHIDSQLNTDDNMPSGDPTESPAAKRQAMMLGMTLLEESEGHIHVKDVAATSPAWDAGIRPGDRVLAIDGIKPKKLAPWIDDVGRVLKDTPDGHAISTDVERNGDKLALRIRVPVSKAAEVRDARQEERALAEMGANNQQQQMPIGQQGVQPIASAGETAGAGYDRGYGGSGLGGWGIGGFFDDEEQTRSGNNTSDDRLANQAIAQLMAVNTLSGGANNQAAQGQNTQSTGGQVGVAAFQNMAQGVHAIVVVRGLPQGTYRVGIGQGDAFAGGFGSDAMGTGAVGIDPNSNGAQNQSNDASQSFNGRNLNRRDLNRGNGGGGNRVIPQPHMNNRPGAEMPQRPGTGVQPAPAGGGAPAGGAGAAAGAADGASLARPHGAAILGQQMDQQQMQGTQNRDAGIAPGTFPNNQTGQNNNSSGAQGAFPNNQTGNGNQSQTSNNTSNNINPANANNNIRPTPLGILRVGPDGSGRVENQLDGVQVRSLVGMSVTIFSDMAQGGGLSGTGPEGNQNAAQNRQQRPTNPSAMSRGQDAAGQMQGNAMQQNAMQQNQAPGALNGGSSQGIVATGVIQIMEGNNGLGQQQDRSLFPGDQGNSDQRNRERAVQDGRNGGQISDPREDFNPDTPQ